MPNYSTTKARMFQWIGIVLILAVFAGAYWYFKVYGSTLNQSQNDMVTNGLVGLWSFNGDDISGTTAYDRSGSGNNGTLTNGPAKVKGQVGQALNFFPGGSDADAYVTMGDPGGGTLDFGSGDFSVGFWMKGSGYSSQGSSVNIPVGKKNVNAPNTAGYGFRYSSANQMLFAIGNGTTDYDLTATLATANDNQWHHYVGLRSGSTTYLYIDGVFNTSMTATSGSVSNSDSFVVGDDTGGQRNVNAAIDEVRVYNTALTAAQIQSLYNLGQSDKTNSSILQPQGTGRLDSGLAGYWKLDENTGTSAADASTNGSNGTLTNGPTWATGQIGSGVTFDGTNDYITISPTAAIKPQANMSISAWVKRDASGEVDYIFWERDASVQEEGLFFYMGTDNKVHCIFRVTGTGFVDITSTTTITDTNWHMVTAVSGAANLMTFYIDGVFAGSGTTTTPNTGLTINSAIMGARNGGGSPDLYGDVTLDEVRFYNRILSADEVAQLYRLTSPTGVDTGLKGYWSFNGQDVSGTTAYDRSGAKNTGTLTNSPTKVTGKVGQALSFDGTDDYVTVADANTLDITGAISMGVWIKTSDTDSCIMSKAIGSSDKCFDLSANKVYEIGILSSAVYFQTSNGTTANVISGSATPLLDNQWHYLMATWDGTTGSNGMKLYLDGTVLYQGTATVSTIQSSSSAFTFGGNGNNWDFSGLLDEGRLYNRALSAAEVKGLYDAGADDKTNSSVSQPQGTGRLDSGLAGYWPLDNGSGTSATDVSTNGNTGTLTNGPTWTTGQIGSAVTFDGTDDHISTAAATVTRFPLTVSAWFKTSNATDSYRTVVNVGNASSGDPLAVLQFTSSVDPCGGGKVKYIVRDDGQFNSASMCSTSSSLNDNTWHHAIGVSSSAGDHKFYIDGVLQASSTTTLGTTTFDRVSVGALRSASQYFPGSVDDVRVYSRGLSSDEISRLYRLTAPTGVDTSLKGYWSFNGQDMSGTTAYDRSGIGNTGTLTNGPTKTIGKISQALSFDGTNDYVDVTNTTYTGEFTYSWWYKTSNNSQTGIMLGGDTTGGIYIKYGLVSGNYFIRVIGGGSSDNTVAPAAVNAWHHMVVTRNSSNKVDLYVDGGSATRLFSDVAQSGNTTIDYIASSADGQYFSGQLDEVRTYNRAFSAAEVAALYNQGR